MEFFRNCVLKLKLKRVLSLVLVFVVVTSIVALGIKYIPYVLATDYTPADTTTWCDQADVPSDIGNLTVATGTTVTVGCKVGGVFESSGITLTALGTVTVNGTLVLVGENSTNTDGVGVHIDAANIVVGSSGSISANAQGYTGRTGSAGVGNGPGGGNTSGGWGGGGAYGSTAQTDGGVTSPAVYGTSTAPTELGSGGGSAGTDVGGNGGGAIRLSVSGTLTLNGTISAIGGNGSGFNGGAGSGGSIYVTTNTLTGSGSFSVKGGNGVLGGSASDAGGGGRLVVYYLTSTASEGLFTGSTAVCGNSRDGSTTWCGNGTTGGTSAFFQVTDMNTHTTDTTRSLTVYQHFDYATSTALTLQNITTTSTATLSIPGGSTITLSGTLLTAGTSVITLQSKDNTAQVDSAWVGTGVTITAVNIQVNSGSSLSANAQGYTGRTGSAGVGNGPGGGDFGGGWGGGAGYGGMGGAAGSVSGGITYGTSTAPTELGSGGGSAGTDVGGNGGGAIRLSVSGTLTLNGTISAIGGNGSGFNGGAGSGGSIYVTTATLSGSGTISAIGGNGTGGAGTAGGGGRIAIYYTGRVSDTTTRTVSGGTSFSASPGTIVFGSQPTLTALDPADTITTGSSVFFGMTVNDGDARILDVRLQYVIRIDTNCAAETFTSSVTTLDSTSTPGWSGTGSYDTSGGAQNVYLIRNGLSNGNYCWRAAAKASTGDFTDYGSFSTTRLFVVNPISLALGALFNTHTVSLTVNPAAPVPTSTPSSTPSSTPATGGSTSLASVLALLAASSTPPSTPPTEIEPPKLELPKLELPKELVFLRSLVLGSKGDDVYILKSFLAKVDLYSGPISSFFGPKTEEAVGTFQCTYGIACVGDTSYGKVLKKTLAQLNTLVPDALDLSLFKSHATTLNVRNVELTSQRDALLLEWQNPPQSEFKTIKVVRSETFYPLTPQEGITVFEGSAEQVVDTTAIPGKKYYYSIFTVDREGNVASGAIAATIASTVPVVPTQTHQEIVRLRFKDVAVPPVNVTSLISPLLTVRSQIGGREIIRPITPTTFIETTTDSSLTFALSQEKEQKVVKFVTLQFDATSYLLAKTETNNAFLVRIITPKEKGTYEAAFSVFYQDGTSEEIKANILVDPAGYVYTKRGDEEWRVPGVRISLYVQDKSTKEFTLWNATPHAQKNPHLTTGDGSFSFLVPPGTYYLTASKSGYEEVKTDTFKIDTKLVTRVIELKPMGFEALVNVNYIVLWKLLGLIVLVVVCTVVLRREKYVRVS